MIDKVLKEKGHLSLASLTVAEFIAIMDAYKNDQEFEKAIPIEAVSNRKGLLTQKEVLDKIGKSRSTFYRMRRNGLIPEYNAGGHPRFVLEEVLKAIHQNGLAA